MASILFQVVAILLYSVWILPWLPCGSTACVCIDVYSPCVPNVEKSPTTDDGYLYNIVYGLIGVAGLCITLLPGITLCYRRCKKDSD